MTSGRLRSRASRARTTGPAIDLGRIEELEAEVAGVRARIVGLEDALAMAEETTVTDRAGLLADLAIERERAGTLEAALAAETARREHTEAELARVAAMTHPVAAAGSRSRPQGGNQATPKRARRSRSGAAKTEPDMAAPPPAPPSSRPSPEPPAPTGPGRAPGPLPPRQAVAVAPDLAAFRPRPVADVTEPGHYFFCDRWHGSLSADACGKRLALAEGEVARSTKGLEARADANRYARCAGCAVGTEIRSRLVQVRRPEKPAA